MAITDQELLSQVQRGVMETADGGQTFPSGLWTAAEVLAYVNQRQQQFVKETRLLIGRAHQPATLNQHEQTLPDDWVATRRVAWKTNAGIYSRLYKVDQWEIDRGLSTWITDTAAVPKVFLDRDGDTLVMRVVPKPTSAGTVVVVYVVLTPALDGTGTDILSVPDDFSHALKWGAWADMLGKVGRAQDPERAQLAEARYQEWVELTKMLID